MPFSSQSMALSSDNSVMVMCVMAMVGAAPCSCFCPGGIQTALPGPMAVMARALNVGAFGWLRVIWRRAAAGGRSTC